MVKTLTEDFNTFINKISLNSNEEDDIKYKHNSLTDMIKKEPPAGYVIDKTRLSGSYAKHCVLNEYEEGKIPDVDVIVIIKECNEDVDKIVKDFYDYFTDKKGNVTSNIRIQSNSIGLIYSNISVDIVIGVLKNDELKICSHKKNEWISSNSLKHIDYMIEKNKKYEGFSYYDLMKLFKYLNKQVLDNKLKSYTLEQLVHQCAPAPRVGLRLYQAFNETLSNIANIYSIFEIKDCCDSHKYGYDDKDILMFDLFMNEIKENSNLAKDAIRGKRKNWEKIFGERFPKQPDVLVENGVKYDKSQTPWCSK